MGLLENMEFTNKEHEMNESIKDTIFEKLATDYYEELPDDASKETMILKIMYLLLSR